MGTQVWVCLETLQVAKRVSIYTTTQSGLNENQANTLRKLNKIHDYSSVGRGITIKMLTMCVCLHPKHLYAHNSRETH